MTAKSLRTVSVMSLEAFYSLPPDYLNDRQAQVWTYILQHPDVCAEEIMTGLGARSPNQVAPRVTELLKMGAIEISGKTITKSGRRANTFRVVEGFA